MHMNLKKEKRTYEMLKTEQGITLPSTIIIFP